MTDKIKKIIILFIFVNSVFVYAGPAREQQTFGSIQLKIINLTDDTIKFYFNRLYHPTEIKSQEEYVTMNTLVSTAWIPIGFNIAPSFIGIQYNNTEDIIIYRFQYHISERIYTSNGQYIVVVQDSSINFIEGDIDDIYDYFDETLYESRWKDYDWRDNELSAYYREHGYPISNWVKERYGERFININIHNNSGSRKIIYLYSVYEELVTIRLGNGMTETYTIDYLFFSHGGIRLQVNDSGWSSDSIILRNISRPNPNRTGYTLVNNIGVKININGHEIIYD